jgi:hypothetical protein
VTGIPRSDRSRSATRQTKPPARSLSASQRKDLHAELLAVLDEAVEERLRLESFGDGGDRHPGQAGPGAGVVVVREVRERADHAASGRVRVAEQLLVDCADAVDDLLVRPLR